MKKTIIAIFIGITLIILGGCSNLQAIPSKAAQIEFLKKNEPLITQYVKSLSDDSPNKITSVQYDWTGEIENTMSDASNPTAKYDSINFSGVYVNGDKSMEEDMAITITLNDLGKLDYIKSMDIIATGKFMELYHVDGIPWKEYRK